MKKNNQKENALRLTAKRETNLKNLSYIWMHFIEHNVVKRRKTHLKFSLYKLRKNVSILTAKSIKYKLKLLVYIVDLWFEWSECGDWKKEYSVNIYVYRYAVYCERCVDRNFWQIETTTKYHIIYQMKTVSDGSLWLGTELIQWN